MHRIRPFVLLLLLFSVLIYFFVEYWDLVYAWAKVQQRMFQNSIAREILDLRGGDLSALFFLVFASGAYGIVHAIGPGHGKVLIGAAAFTSQRTALAMAGIGFAASLVQGVSAILLTYGVLGVLFVTSTKLIGVAENYLASVSFLAMAAVGAWIIYRGIRLIAPLTNTKNKHTTCSHGSHNNEHHSSHHGADGTCEAGCKHMPTAQEVETLRGWRDVLFLIFSIGIRPCSGALIVLIITWKFGLLAAGVLSAMAMAIGTGLVVSAAAIFASKIRNLSIAQFITEDNGKGIMFAGALNIGAGVFVIAMSSLFFMNDLRTVVYPL